MHVLPEGCALARRGFQRQGSAAEALVGGRSAPRRAAVEAAARLLREARCPLIGGLATDVEGTRAALALAERTGGIVDHGASAAANANLQTLRERGWVLTTHGEVRNRADLLVLVGTTAVDTHPRFFERLVGQTDGLFTEGPRSVIVLGRGLNVRAIGKPAGVRLEHLPAARESLAEVALALRGLLAGRRLDAAQVAGLRRASLEGLAARLREARYPVVVWNAGLLPTESAALTVQAWSELARELNATGRCAGLPLGGGEGSASANQVSAWQTGYPLPVRFSAGHPQHDPERFQAARALDSGDADLLVWVSGLGSAMAAPETSRPVILLADQDGERAGRSAVFLPVGTAGVDHPGRLFRGDGVVCLPLRALRPAAAPSVAETLNAILEAL